MIEKEEKTSNASKSTGSIANFIIMIFVIAAIIVGAWFIYVNFFAEAQMNNKQTEKVKKENKNRKIPTIYGLQSELFDLITKHYKPMDRDSMLAAVADKYIEQTIIIHIDTIHEAISTREMLGEYVQYLGAMARKDIAIQMVNFRIDSIATHTDSVEVFVYEELSRY